MILLIKSFVLVRAALVAGIGLCLAGAAGAWLALIRSLSFTGEFGFDHFRLRSRRLSLFVLLVVSLMSAISTEAQTSWKGTTSTSWTDAANWTAGIPTASVDVIIGDTNFTGANQPGSSGSSVCKSLTIGTGAKVSTLSINRRLTVAGNITIGANGTISHSGNSTISLTGNWTNSGTYVTTGSASKNSTVTFSGTAQSISGATTFKLLTVSAGSIAALNNAISVSKRLTVSGTLDPRESPAYAISGAGALTVNSGGKIQVKASTYAGNYALSGATTLSAGSIVEYAAVSNNQTVSSGFTYSTLRISGGSTKALVSNLPLLNSSTNAGNIDVAAGTLDLSSFTANRGTTTVGGTFTVGNGATLKIGGTSSFPGNYATRSLQAGSSVEYAGANQTVSAETYGNLLLSSSGGGAIKTMPATAFVVAGSLSSAVGSGTSVSFTSSAPMTVNGNVTLGTNTTFNAGSFSHSVGANWTNQGTLAGGTSTITFVGPNGILAGSGNSTFNNLTLARSGITLAPNTSITVAGNLTTTGVGTFTHTPGGTGTVTMSGAAKTIGGLGLSFNHLAISGSINTANSFAVVGNLNVTGSFAASAGTLTLSGAAATFHGGGTATLNALNVIGTVSTTNNFSVASDVSVSGLLTASAGTMTFNGSATLSGTANLFNATLNGTRLQLGSSAVLGIAGLFTQTAGTFDVATSAPNTVTYNGAGAQTVLATTYDNLTLTGSGTKTAGGALTVNRDLSIAGGSTFSAGAFTHTLLRNWINSGTFTASAGTILLSGNLDSTLSGVTTFNILTINKSSSANVVTLNASENVATLNMTQGVLETGPHTVTITTTRTGGGLINGTITRTHAFTTGVAYAFEGTNNTVTFVAANGVSSISMTISLRSVSDFPFGSSINREYAASVTASGVYDATLRLHYQDIELNGNSESAMQLWRHSGSWGISGKTANDPANNWTEQSGLTNLLGRWTLSDNANVVRWNGLNSTNWETAANWTLVQGTPSLPPSTNDVVQLGAGTFVHQPAISSAVVVKSIAFGSNQTVNLAVGTGGTLTTIGNIGGAWTSNLTHSISVGARSLNVGGDLTLSDGTNGRAINVSVDSGEVTIAGRLTQSGGANLTFTGAGLLRIGGDFDYVSGTFLPGTGTVIYNGASEQAVAGVPYHRLTIDKPAGTATLFGTTTVGGDLLVTNVSTFGVAVPLTVTGSVTIESNATLIASFPATTISVGSNWTRRGNFTPGMTTVLFNGGDAQAISASTFNNLTINKTNGVATLSGSVTINSDFSISAGTLDLAGFVANRSVQGGTFTLAASTTLKVGSGFPANFAVRNLSTSSTVEYNASTAQNVAGETYGHLIFANGGSNAKTLTAATTVLGDLLISSNATFNAAVYLTDLYGSWTNRGVFAPGTGTLKLSGTSKFLSGNTILNNLTVVGTYTVVGSDLTILGNLLVSGSFDFGSGTATLDGDLTNTGSLSSSGTTSFTGTRVQTLQLLGAQLSSSTGVINYNGTVAPVLFSTTSPQYVSLNINNTAGVAASVGWTVFGPFTVGSGSAFHGGAVTHTFYGSFANNGTVTSSGTLDFRPSSARTLSLRGTSFISSGTVRFGGSGQITLAGSAPSLDTVIIANTHSAGITPNTGWTLSRDLVISGGATFKGGAGLTHTIAGSVFDDGIFDGETSTVVLNGVAEIGGGGATTFHHLLITGGATNSAGFDVSGNLTNNGSFDATGYTIKFTGTLASTIAASASPMLLDSLAIEKNAATVMLAVNLSALTELIVSGGTLDASTFTISEDVAGGVFTVGAGATFKTGVSSGLPSFVTYSFDPTSTVEFAGAGAQTIAAQNFGGLKSSAAGARTLAGTGMIGIAGAFTPGGNSYTIAGSTISFNGAGAQTVPAFNYHHLMSSSSGARTLANTGTIGVAGTFTPGANGYTTTGSTISFNGAAQTIPAFTFHNLSTSGSGTKSLGGNVTVGGALVLAAGSFADAGFVATVHGDIDNSITHSGAGRILLSSGTTNHVISGTGTFNNLELNDTNNAVLSDTNLTVAGTLTLTAGTIATSTNRVIVTSGGSVVRSNGYVAGSLQKSVTAAVTNRTFEIGDATTYAPVVVIFTNVTVAGSLTVSTTAGDHPAITNSDISTARSVNRYWSLTNSGVAFGSASAVFQFAPSDIDAGSDPSTFVVAKRFGGTWTLPTAGTKNSTNTQVLGVSSFGDFQVGQSASVPAITTQPQSQSVTVGQNMTFTVGATGTDPLSYQWRFNGNNLSGANSTNFAITNVQTSNAGSYSVVVTNVNGAETSLVATLTVIRASTTSVVSSSANPASPGSNVTFTATLTAVAPSSGTPAGTVQFRADGVALGSAVTLVSGVASLDTASLSHGTHTVTAEYVGDSNFFGSTNSLTQSINAQPLAATDILQRYQNSAAKVRIATVLSNDSDADSDVLTFSSVSTTSVGGGTVVVSGLWIHYTPPPGFTNSDSFSYVMADSGGLQATGLVSVTIFADTAVSQNIVVEDLGNNISRLRFAGIPGRAYAIQYAENLLTPDWQTLITQTADATGAFDYTDTPPQGAPTRFYRSTVP